MESVQYGPNCGIATFLDSVKYGYYTGVTQHSPFKAPLVPRRVRSLQSMSYDFFTIIFLFHLLKGQLLESVDVHGVVDEAPGPE